MDAEMKDLIERRRAAVQAFIEENAELWATSDIEREAHALDCTEDDCTFGDRDGLSIEDGWMLIVRQVPMDDSGNENFLKVTSKGLTWSRQLGFTEYVRDALGMS